MGSPESDRPVGLTAPSPETPRGPGETVARLLLAYSPLGAVVRRVARIRASVHSKLLGAFLLIALLLIAMGAMSLQAIGSVVRQSSPPGAGTRAGRGGPPDRARARPADELHQECAAGAGRRHHREHVPREQSLPGHVRPPGGGRARRSARDHPAHPLRPGPGHGYGGPDRRPHPGEQDRGGDGPAPERGVSALPRDRDAGDPRGPERGGGDGATPRRHGRGEPIRRPPRDRHRGGLDLPGPRPGVRHLVVLHPSGARRRRLPGPGRQGRVRRQHRRAESGRVRCPGRAR